MSHDSVGGVIDDSALFHASKYYDPQKAREYYLRTRVLKGRKKGSADDTVTRREFKRAATGNEGTYARPGGKPNRSKTKSRRAELQAQKEALQKRLERLREVLEELVEAAKKRSGGDPNKKKDDKKDRAPETPKDKADRNKDRKKDKPETAAEKKERAKKAKEEYEKEHPNSLSTDVEILKEQVADIQKKIQAQLDAARERRSKSGPKDNAARETRKKSGKQDQRSGSKNDNDEPRGR